MKRIVWLVMLFSVSVTFFACKKDSATIPDPTPVVNQKYVFSYWLSDYTQYIWSVDSLKNLMQGEISMEGAGIEQGGDCIPVNNTFFAAKTGDEGAVSYILNSGGQLASNGKIALESIYAIGHTDDDKAILIGASWEVATTNIEISIYDPVSKSITKRALVDVAANYDDDTLLYWPAGATVSGNYLYIPSFLRSANWDLDYTDTAYLRVYSYPGLEYVTTLKDARTGPVGMYYTNSGIIRNEAGDVYTFSSAAYAAGYPGSTKPSGILRIMNGSNEFDPNYFFNIEQSAIHGKVIAGFYVGNNKAVITYIPAGLDSGDNLWAFLNNTKPIFKSAIVDLANQTVTPVTGLPDHTGDEYYGLNSLYYEDGKAYKSFMTNTESRIYSIDLASAVATPGALIKGGLHIPVISRLTY